MAETRQPFAPAQARGHRRRRAVGPGYLVEQGRHPRRLAAVPGPCKAAKPAITAP